MAEQKVLIRVFRTDAHGMATSVTKLPEFLTAILAKARKYEIPDQKLPLIRDFIVRRRWDLNPRCPVKGTPP